MPPAYYAYLFSTFAFILGASIGSFLNVCIYRMPRDLSVNEPRRSFCPTCKYQIPFWHNIPLFSWLALRGKCANCGAAISFRYFGVELLAGLLFLGVWWKVWPHSWVLALPFWILVSLLVIATFIDFEFFIIPDEITWGGVVAGVVLSLAIPTLMDTDSNLVAACWSLAGAAFGYFLLRGVVELGKRAFGKKAFAMRNPTNFSWVRRAVTTEHGTEYDADLVVGDVTWKSAPKLTLLQAMQRQFLRLLAFLRLKRFDDLERGESWIWSEIFSRESDILTMNCQAASVDGENIGEAALKFTYDEIAVADRKWKLDRIARIEGVVKSLVVPREAMGFGDVKFIAAIGAFLGWKAVLFTVMAGSTFGAVVGLTTIALGKREWSAKIPFGPYLALGALVWMFAGPEILAWYLAFSQPAV